MCVVVLNEGDDSGANGDSMETVPVDPFEEDANPLTSTASPLRGTALSKVDELAAGSENVDSVGQQSSDQRSVLSSEDIGEVAGLTTEPIKLIDSEVKPKGKRGRPPVHDQAQKRRLRLQEV